MIIAPGRHRGPGRYTDRAIRIGIRKARATRSQRIQIRRFYQRMAAATHHRPIMLVGHNEEQIGWFH